MHPVTDLEKERQKTLAHASTSQLAHLRDLNKWKKKYERLISQGDCVFDVSHVSRVYFRCKTQVDFVD